MKKQTFLLLVCSFLFATFLFADNPHVPRGPVIVADVAEVSQTSAQTVTLFTPSSDGTFRISIYGELSGTVSGSTFVDAGVEYTDDLQTRSFPGGAPSCNIAPTANFCQEVATIHAKSGTNINGKFGTNGFTLPSGGSYTFFVIVEQL